MKLSYGVIGSKPLAVVRIPIPPVPASRPRVTRSGGVFHAPRYADWLAQARRHVRKGPFVLPKDTPFAVIVGSYIKRARTSKLAFPVGDVDNYAKGPLDVLTKVGGYWKDDKQVVSLRSYKTWATEEFPPQTLITIYGYEHQEKSAH